ncbi:MAG: GAF domain-containing protein, partial [Chloroflexi bacterium]|nr:GAF domain-containing protein [Chloroflexota bacterium]
MKAFSELVLAAALLLQAGAVLATLRYARGSRSVLGWLSLAAALALLGLHPLSALLAQRLPDLSQAVGTPADIFVALLATFLFLLGIVQIGRTVRLAAAAESVQHQRTRELESLNATAIALQRVTTEDEIFQAVASETGRMGLWTCFFSFSEDQHYGVMRYLAAPSPDELEQLWRRSGLQPGSLTFALARMPAEFRRVQAGETVVMARAAIERSVDDPCLRLLTSIEVAQMLMVPLRVGTGQVVGGLVLLGDSPSRSDLPGALLLGRQIAAGLESVHARSEARLRRRATLERLAQVSQGITAGLQADHVMGAVCRTLVQNLGYRMAWVATMEGGGEPHATLAAHAGAGADAFPEPLVRLADTEMVSGPPGAALWSGRSSVWHDREDAPASAPWQAALREMGCASLIALPLGSQGDAWGVLAVASSEAYAFTEDTVPILEMLANQTAAAVEHSRSYSALMEERRRLSLLHEVAREVNS